MADKTNKEVAYDITGDASPYVAALGAAAAATTTATADIKKKIDGIGGAFSLVQKQLLMLAAVVAGGAFFKESIDATNKLTGETMNLARRLGLTTEQASALNTALGDIGADSDLYVGAFEKFAKQLKTNEDGLKAMGLQTRDASGNLRDSNDLFMDAVQVVGQYKPGLDQTTAGMTLFGKSVEEVMKLQRLNNDLLDDAKRKNAELGLTITKENVEASKKYKAAMNDVGDILMAVQKAIGDAVMPVFTELGEYLAETGPYMVNLFKGALTGLLLVFRVVQANVKTTVAIISETINQLIDQLGNLSELLAAVFRGDFGAAARIWESMGQRFKQGLSNVVDATREAYRDAADKFSGDLTRTWGKGTEMAAPKGGGKRMGEFKSDKDTGDKSRMSEWEAALEERKLAIAEQARAEGTFREMSKADELAYWEQIRSAQKLSAQESIAVRRKVATTALEINKGEFDARMEQLRVEREALQRNYEERAQVAARAWAETVQRYGAESKEAKKAYGEILAEQRAYAAQQRQLDSMAADSRRAARTAELELERAATAEALQLGLITKAQALQAEQRHEEALYMIRLEALRERAALIDPALDPVAYAQATQAIEAAAQAHQARMGQLQSGLKVEQFTPMLNIFKTLEDGMQRVAMTVVTSWRQAGQALRAVLAGIAQAIIGEVIVKPMAAKAAAWVKERALTVAGVEADAVKAGSGAAASQASIPFVGPMLALAAMVAIMSQVRGQSGKIPSARGGFDIPRGANPMVQLHEEEMVLPAKHADVIRELSEGRGAGGRGDVQAPVTIRGTSAGDFFIAHRREMEKLFRSMNRNFEFV